ncbi:GNAT family N-acetyltransferase [Phycicoccus flavus]|uniref:GNAT family N-acetyltransferase n=1 Tax=Phycicoccus flavus TaxID=2502783 RepID=UPI000FEBA6E7|nr:GNAT family N-acetyltransferase [Phycicoccus flavus]NHA66560.1 GNAT family N-acetyltransferase [Phycicoccus flavus]
MLVRSAPLSAVPPVTLYAVLRLRQDVFVLEQQCLYPDLDGRDLEPGAVHYWAEADDGAVLGTLRALDEGGGVVRVGRVATATSARGTGVAAALVQAVLAATRGPVVLDAQSHLEGWYERLGFGRDGAEFVEDGIPHVPMRLTR